MTFGDPFQASGVVHRCTTPVFPHEIARDLGHLTAQSLGSPICSARALTLEAAKSLYIGRGDIGGGDIGRGGIGRGDVRYEVAEPFFKLPILRFLLTPLLRDE